MRDSWSLLAALSARGSGCPCCSGGHQPLVGQEAGGCGVEVLASLGRWPQEPGGEQGPALHRKHEGGGPRRVGSRGLNTRR